MPSNDLAAAVERLLSPTQPDEYWEPDYEYGEPDHHTAEKDLPMVAQACRAYLARESDDAKPVDREWLVSVLGEPQTNYDDHARWVMGDDAGEFVVYEYRGESWCFIPCEDQMPDGDYTGAESMRYLRDRADVRAFLRLAEWPTNENGGE